LALFRRIYQIWVVLTVSAFIVGLLSRFMRATSTIAIVNISSVSGDA
jgi:hypothetical protein